MTVKPGETRWPEGAVTGGAWLSSARVVRCLVKSSNERNPRRMLPAPRVGTHAGPPESIRRRAGTTSSHHAPYALGCTRATMAGTAGCDGASRSGSLKAGPSSDWGLQPAPHEVGVASNRGSACRGECVPGPCTHRPSHHPSRLHPKSPAQPFRGEAPKVWEGEGGEVVTR